jgi:hypothetical protein
MFELVQLGDVRVVPAGRWLPERNWPENLVYLEVMPGVLMVRTSTFEDIKRQVG